MGILSSRKRCENTSTLCGAQAMVCNRCQFQYNKQFRSLQQEIYIPMNMILVVRMTAASRLSSIRHRRRYFQLWGAFACATIQTFRFDSSINIVSYIIDAVLRFKVNSNPYCICHPQLSALPKRSFWVLLWIVQPLAHRAFV
jgi:hypothetical protein